MPRKLHDVIGPHIAGRLKQRRQKLGLSQSAVASIHGIRYQQIQKYENCIDRVSASRLYEIAWQLQVPIEWFFEGIDLRDHQSR